VAKKEWKYIDNHSKLPLHVPAISNFLVDPAHHCKSFARDLLKLVDEKGRKLGFNKIDYACLKCIYNYWLQENCNDPYEVFAASNQNHFRNHEFCKRKKEGCGVSTKAMMK